MAQSKGIKKSPRGPAVRIAPKELSNWTDRQLELLVRHKLKKYPQLLGPRKYLAPRDKASAQFELVEKRSTAPKWMSATNESRLKAEEEIAKLTTPGPSTYE